MTMVASVMCHYLVSLGLLIISNIDGALTCHTGTLEECHALPFVPGYERAGEGYDVVKLERKGAYVFDVYNYLSPTTNSCRICSNPMMGGQLQKLPYYMADWRSQNQCKREIQTSAFSSVTSAVESASSVITNDWKIGLGLRDIVGVEMAGSQSKLHSFSSSSFQSDKSIIIVNQFSCAYYRFRASSTYPLSGEFQRDIQFLPLDYTPITTAPYRRLIDNYGTHYIHQVDLGGRMNKVTTISTCLATLTEGQVEHCLSTGIKVGLGFVGLDLDIMTSEACAEVVSNHDTGANDEKGFLKHMTEVVGGNGWSGEFSLATEDSDGFTLWKNSLKSIPDILSFTVTPLHELVADRNIRSNLRTAIRDYVIENGINKTYTNILKCPLQDERDNLAFVVEVGYNNHWAFWLVGGVCLGVCVFVCVPVGILLARKRILKKRCFTHKRVATADCTPQENEKSAMHADTQGANSPDPSHHPPPYADLYPVCLAESVHLAEPVHLAESVHLAEPVHPPEGAVQQMSVDHRAYAALRSRQSTEPGSVAFNAESSQEDVRGLPHRGVSTIRQ